MKINKSYTEVAQQTGLSVSHVSRVMRQKKKPSMDALIKIAWALDMKAEEFVRRMKIKGSKT